MKTTFTKPRQVGLSVRSIRAALKRAPGRVWSWDTTGWWTQICEIRTNQFGNLEARQGNLNAGGIMFAVWHSPVFVVESESTERPKWKPHHTTIRVIVEKHRAENAAKAAARKADAKA